MSERIQFLISYTKFAEETKIMNKLHFFILFIVFLANII